jgi:hypothetical protein
LLVLQTAEWLVWIGLGSVAGAVSLFTASLFAADWALGAPACEPDEAVGCGVSVVLLALLLGLPSGAVLGGVGASRLHHRLR